jgi:hypothetical protein
MAELGRPRHVLQQLVGDLLQQLGSALLHRPPQGRRRVRLLPVVTEAPDELAPGRIDVRLRDLPEGAIILDEKRGTPVGEKRDRQTDHALQRGGVVERIGEHAARLGEEGRTSLRGAGLAVE